MSVLASERERERAFQASQNSKLIGTPPSVASRNENRNCFSKLISLVTVMQEEEEEEKILDQSTFSLVHIRTLAT